MKAIVWMDYGPPEVLQLKEVAKPVPNKNEILIKIYATTVTTGDCELRSLKLPVWIRFPMQLFIGIRKPRRITILGQELAGEIEAVGAQVSRFKIGDMIFAPTLFHFGAYAEYVCLPETNLVLKPANITYEQAATLPTGAISGLHFIKVADVRSGQIVLIYGAGGSIGTYAVQIARSLGAKVTAVDSAEKRAMLLSIGADHVIDYTREDFTRNSETYDAIIDVVGKSSFSGSVRALKPEGRYVLGNASMLDRIRAGFTRKTDGRKILIAVASYKPEYYILLEELFAAGKLRSIIDRSYPLDQIAEAHRYVDEGHKKGNIVITVQRYDKP